MSYPATNEDYLKALEEAYRQGAAAAAQMALQEEQQSIHSRASCPDFGGHPIVPNSNQHQQQHHHSGILPFSVPDPLFPPQPSSSLNNYPSEQHHPSQQQQYTMPPPPPLLHQQQQHHDVTPTDGSTTAQHRSFSMPDMSIYASQKQEDIKRHKRLARNRASARIRRLRKKQLVDEYETEVKSLGNNIQQLQEHEWGQLEEHQSLVRLLSMERGQEELDATQRQEAVASLLSQQLQVVQQLQELMQEQYVLYEVAANHDYSSEFEELASLLELTESQRKEIQRQANGWMQEWQALQIVEESLLRMQEHEWLSKNGIPDMVEELYSLFNKNQLSKFLIWTDINRDAIEFVNMVNTVPCTSLENDGPVFQFGVGENACEEGFHHPNDLSF